MPNWSGSDRRERLPADWPRIRIRILRRDGHRCTHRDQYGERCEELATDVDHIVPGDDHRETNLRALCGFHHRAKSSREGALALAVQRRRIDRRFRRTEAHPGLM
ncbi:HNH endonuclease [Streptomyces sp. KAI-26]|uniref:HNH endonuclease n=1 Tax=Streptomyces sp. KAI-26 TaxID=1169747 RepID=UPI0015876EBD|nr:HNH endonuclease signature motif containing protein [Streptomyces sp. KAI-26]NUV86604.1 HNH endonuclease [Streptomyces sp. KAI-26]NUW21201.1 HNH endonuclease [Streptomyces roseoviolaceus]